MGIITVVVVFLLVVLVVLPTWVFLKISSFTRENELQRLRFETLEAELATLRRELAAQRAAPSAPAAAPTAAIVSPAAPTAPLARAPEPAVVQPPIQPQAIAPSATPAPPQIPTPASEPPPLAPPPRDPAPAPRPAPVPYVPPPAKPSIDWEQFMGAKLFAWFGALAGFLAVGFFVKYSFEHDLIPPEVRIALGYLFSAALVIGGRLISRERFRVTAQALCATGIVSLYAVTFASHAVYHFAPFSPLATFALMALITAAAFLLAVRMEAQVVAILGLLGGFITPVLLSTGHDNAPALFGYLALLDAGLIAVALHRRWLYLVALAAAATVLMQLGWADKFFAVEKMPVTVAVCLGFSALFFSAMEIGQRREITSRFLVASAAALPLVALGFAFNFLRYDSIGGAPAALFSFVLLADLFLLGVAWRAEGAARLNLLGGGLVFALLGLWTAEHLTPALLPWGLAAYLVFAVLHTAWPLVLSRTRPDAAPTWWSQLYPPLTLLLLLVPIFKIDSLSLLFWPAVLAVDVIAVVLALFSTSIVALGLVLVLTLAATGAFILKSSGTAVEPLALLAVVGGFSLFFFAAGLFLLRKLGRRLADGSPTGSSLGGLVGDARAHIPAFSALLPFALLIMMSQQLAFANPSSLFGLALLLVVLVLGLTRLLTIAWLPVCALAGVAALEYAWHARHFSLVNPAVPLGWYLGFYALFAMFPFVFRRSFAGLTGPWAVAALSGIAHFPLVYQLMRAAWPNEFPGVLPALFALAPLVSLVAVLRAPDDDASAHRNQLAWFGGVALCFITLVFPIQFDRQWITIGWALEGAALIWLFGRVPHRGLLGTGVVLLVIAFARLSMNRAVFTYHARSDVPVFNWYLYTYGIAIAALFIGAWLLRPRTASPTEAPAEPERVFGVSVVPLLNALGTILTFLLLNIEIADYFATTGQTLTFEFSGNFARDMAYTIGWALFALGLLAAGIWRRTRAARYAALALLSVTLLKLFFHDLAHLGQLYRVGALIAVAAVAILASFLYQRFIPNDARTPPPPQS
jgi:hypothetical protein